MKLSGGPSSGRRPRVETRSAEWGGVSGGVIPSPWMGVRGIIPGKILKLETQFGAIWCILARNWRWGICFVYILLLLFIDACSLFYESVTLFTSNHRHVLSTSKTTVTVLSVIIVPWGCHIAKHLPTYATSISHKVICTWQLMRGAKRPSFSPKTLSFANPDY